MLAAGLLLHLKAAAGRLAVPAPPMSHAWAFPAARQGNTPNVSHGSDAHSGDRAGGGGPSCPPARGASWRLTLAAVLAATFLLQGAFLLETREFPDFVQPLPGLDINLH